MIVGETCLNPCGLCARPIPSTVVEHPIAMLIGEGPGADEEKYRRPFVGKTGQELTNYLTRAGIPRERIYISNVLRCRPPDNRDPRVEEIAMCLPNLMKEIEEANPPIIIAVGRFAARVLLGDVDMEQVHGIPFWSPIVDRVVVPVYHPSYGLHETENMSLIMADFLAVKAVMMGQIKPRRLDEGTAPGVYQEVDLPDFEDAVEVAVDTEEEEEKGLWCISLSVRPGYGQVVMADNKRGMDAVREYLALPHVTSIIHNMLYDLPMLRKGNVRPSHAVDTMVMAYLLQTEPQGLKALAYRHLGLKMREYLEVVGPATEAKAFLYLNEILSRQWPKPKPIITWVKGEPKVKNPYSIDRRVRGILNDYAKGEKDVDLWKRWHNIKRDEGRGFAEKVLGPMQPGFLRDIDRQEAVNYTGMDADATIRIYPILRQRVDAMGLKETLERDMRAMPLVDQMQENGILIDPPYFESLSGEYQGYMDEIQSKISAFYKKPFNPGSAPQIAQLLYDLKITRSPKLKKGATERAALEQIAHKHWVVKDIVHWKGYDKLKDSYIDVLPAKMDEDGRVRTTLRMTRVVTGRLSSSDPNLMAQPVRTTDGRRIRGGFIARPGFSLVSMDYSQVEMRVVAHDSQDPRMMDIFLNGKDLHTETACWVFEVAPDQVDEMKHRYPSKRIGFGILNLISPRKLLREIELGGAEGWTEARCADAIQKWFGIFEGVKSWIEGKKAEARRHGFVRDMWGRIRLVPELISCHPNIVEAGIRQAVNAPIQMGAQGIIKQAMGDLKVQVVDPFQGYVYYLIQIHDDLVSEVHDDLLPVVVPEMKRIMETCAPHMTVPIKADVKVGKRWMDMKKWKEA